MPMAVPAIAGVAASVGVVAGFGGIAAIGTMSLAAQLGVFALSSLAGSAASFLASSLLGLNKPPDFGQPPLSVGQEGRLEESRNPTAFHQYIFGRIRMHGVQRWAASTNGAGIDNGYFYLIHAFCGAQCHGIRGVYLNEKRATDPVYDGLVRVGKHLGTETQIADTDFVAEYGQVWTADHRGRGITYTATRLTWSQVAFGSIGLPQVSAIIDGITNIYDPRTGVTGFTHNWALCCAHYLTAEWGKKLPWAKLDEPTLIASANICDERVEVSHETCTFVIWETAPYEDQIVITSSNHRVLDWGDGVRVSSSGTLPAGLTADTTYYVIPGDYETILSLATTPANAFAGIAIAITDIGTGAHTLTYWDEARYKCNGMFTADVDPEEVLERLKTAAAGFIFPRGGKWFIHAGAPASLPYDSLTEYDLAGDYQYITKRSLRDSFNGIRGRFFNPENFWQEDDSPVLKPTQALIEEDGEERFVDRVYHFTSSARCVQRLMKIDREINRQQETLEFPANLVGMKFAPLDGVNVNISGRLENKTFRVVNWKLDPSGVIPLSLHGHSGHEYDWTIADEQPVDEPGEIELPDASDITPPEYITVNFTMQPVPTSVWVTWPAVSNVFATEYDVEYRSLGASTWTSYGAVSINAERKVQIPRSPPQDIRIRTRTDTYISDWRESLAPEPPTSLTQSGAGEISWTLGARTAFLQLFKDGVFWNIDIIPLAGPFGGLNDGVYRLRALDAHGNMSALSEEVTVTAAGSGTGGQDNDYADGDGE